MTIADAPRSPIAEIAPGEIEDFIEGHPGIYEHVPAGTYHRQEAASASRLKKFAQSPLHCRHAIDHPEDPTPAMILGTAEHVAILQPELFVGEYVAASQCAAILKSGAKKGNRCSAGGKFLGDDHAWYCGTHEPDVKATDGRQVLSPDDYARCKAMHAAAWDHPAAAKAIESCLHRELSVLWIDKTTKQLCKLRADLVGDVAFDVKTTQDASPEGFSWAIRKFRYDVQAAFYLRGLAAAGITCNGFGFIAVENDAPHGVGVYAIDDLDLIDADLETFGPDGLLARYAKCAKSGDWPGYSTQMRVIRLPWKRKEAIV